jgi:hypothetical protein
MVNTKAQPDVRINITITVCIAHEELTEITAYFTGLFIMQSYTFRKYINSVNIRNLQFGLS